MSSAAAPLTLRRSLAMVWRSLRSMRTALILLLLVALAAVAGSLVPQRTNSPLRVAQTFVDHPLRARIYDSIGLFDVFGSWWFTLLYTLLLVSLLACLVPRTRALVRNLRARPQPARELDAFPHYAQRRVAAAPTAAVRSSRGVLRRRMFRVSKPDGPAIAADKGLARETGSLLFHWSFFLILIGAIYGKGTGFAGFATITEGQCWTEAAANYNGNFTAGRFFDGDHTGIGVCVRDFQDRYRTTGQPMDFVTVAQLRGPDGTPIREVDIRVNQPTQVDGLNLYQYAFGWAPVIEVWYHGKLIASGPVQFEQDPAPPGIGQLAMPWHGVVRLPTLRPQRAIELQLWPDVGALLQLRSGGPPVAMTQPNHPVLLYRVYAGDLASEIRKTSTVLDTSALRQVASGSVGAGTTVDLRTGDIVGSSTSGGGLTVSFPELRHYTVLEVTRDRGVWIVLVAVILILVGLLPALYTSRRRIWVRADPEGSGSLLQVGGYALQRTSQFEEEFSRLVDQLARASGTPSEPTPEPERLGSR